MAWRFTTVYGLEGSLGYAAWRLTSAPGLPVTSIHGLAVHLYIWPGRLRENVAGRVRSLGLSFIHRNFSSDL